MHSETPIIRRTTVAGFSTVVFILIWPLLSVCQQSVSDEDAWYDLAKSSLTAFRNKNYDEAIELALKARAQAEKAFGKDHANYIQSLDNLAYVYFAVEKYADAIQYYSEEIEILKKQIGPTHPDYATALNKLANVYKTSGELIKAEPLYLKALEIRRESQPDNLLCAVSINNLAFLYDAMGKNEDAEKLYREALTLKLKIVGLYHSSTETTIRNFGDFYFKSARYNEAEPLYRDLVTISAHNWGEKHITTADAMFSLADLYEKLERYDDARIFYVRSINIYIEVYGIEHEYYAIAITGLAHLHEITEKFEASEMLYLRARRILKSRLGEASKYYLLVLDDLARLYKTLHRNQAVIDIYVEKIKILKASVETDPANYAYNLDLLGEFYFKIGNYKDAGVLFTRAQTIRQSKFGENHADYAHSVHNLATLSMAIGDYQNAEKLFLQAKEIRKKRLGVNHPDYAITLNNLAALYQTMGRFSEGESVFLEIKEIYRDGKNQKMFMVAQNNLATLYSESGQPEKAEVELVGAVRSMEKLEVKDNFYYSSSLHNLAVVYLSLDMLEKAEELELQSLRIKEKIYGKNNLNYGHSLGGLAIIYEKMGRPKDAEKLYLQALEISKDQIDEHHSSSEMAFENLAGFYSSQNQLEKAEPFYLKANEIMRRKLAVNFAYLSEKEKDQYLNTFLPKFHAFHSFALKRKAFNPSIIAHDYDNVFATKGLLFDYQKKMRSRILNGQDTALISLYQEWLTQQSYLSRIYERTLEQRKEDNIVVSEEEKKVNDLEKELSDKSSIFAKARSDGSIGWKDVQRHLEKDEAAIEIIRVQYYDKHWTDSIIYMAIIIKPNTKDNPGLVVLNNGNELEEKYLRNYRNSISVMYEDTISYDQYWQRLTQELKGIKKVYFAADGIYHLISLGGLLNTHTGRYLGDELEIYRVTSTRDVVTPKRKTSFNGQIKLVGFPAYNVALPNSTDPDYQLKLALSKDSLRFFDGGPIQDLPGTLDEIKELEKICNRSGLPVSVYLEKDATEANIKSWENPRVLHLATHGYFLNDISTYKNKDRIGGIASDAITGNPLLRSGLLLTNARSAFENGGDGILTAYEAKDLNLDKTDLVVLSACETGLGIVRTGEGVYGLQRAIQTAGAATILMSLWTVDDNATRDLMTNFYDAWLIQKQPKRLAFKYAKEKLRTRYPHPFYWAAFVMVGE